MWKSQHHDLKQTSDDVDQRQDTVALIGPVLPVRQRSGEPPDSPGDPGHPSKRCDQPHAQAHFWPVAIGSDREFFKEPAPSEILASHPQQIRRIDQKIRNLTPGAPAARTHDGQINLSDWDEQKSEEDSGDSQWRAVAANDKPDMSTRLRRDEAERQGEDQAKRQKQRVIGGRRDENDHQHDEADQMAERLAARKIQSVADEDQEKISEDGQRRGELELFVNYLSKARPAESKEIGPGATGENGKLQPAAKEEVASRIIREGKQVQLDIYSCKNAETKVSQKPVNETHRQKRIGISQGSCDWIENQRRRPVRAAMKHGIPMFQQKSDESAVAAVGVNDIKATQDRESMEQEDTDYANGPRQATFREGYARRIIRWPGERRLRCVLPAIKSRSWSANCSRVLELAKRVGRSCELVNLDFFAKRCFATSHLLKTRLRDQQFRDRRHQFFSEGKLHSILSRGRWVSHSSRGAFI